MAVMASTVSEPLSLDLKLADAPAEKSLQLNGHATDAPPAEPLPLVNGTAKHNDAATLNGMTPPVELPEALPAKSILDAPPSPKPSNATAPEPEPAAPEVKSSPVEAEIPSEKPAEPVSDVTMGDNDKDTAGAGADQPAQVTAESTAEPLAPATVSDNPAEPSAQSLETAGEVVVEVPAETPADAPLVLPSEFPITESLPNEIKEDVDMVDSAPDAPIAAPVNGDGAAPTTSPRDPDTYPGISQLDINNTPNESFSVAVTAETTMTDAPERQASPVKVARERDDDSIDEPLAKRAKTDSQTDEVMAEVPAAPEIKTGISLDLPGWADADLLATRISDYQRREFRKIIAGLKKTKAGGNFKDSVEKMWPTLWESYSAVIERPTDLSHIDRSLRDQAIDTMGDLQREVALILENSQTFNGPDHDVTKSARMLVEQIWTKAREISVEEPPKSKPAPKQLPTRHTEPRTAAQPPPRRQSTGVTSSPTEKAPPTETYAVPPGGVPQARRASTQNDGDRPKRAIHPPKNKDLDYTPKTINKKKLPPELRFCHDVLEEIRSEQNLAINGPFLHPVDPVALGIPTYFNVIKKPMDLQTVADKLAKQEYSSAKDFEKDVLLIFKNCYKFNGVGNPVTAQGKQLETLFKNEWSKKDQWMARNVQKSGSAGTPSSHSDAETEDDDEEDAAPSGAAASETADLANAVSELGARLQEESAKLNAMFLDDSPNQTIITVQQTVVQTIQQSLLAEKAKLAASQQRSDKPAKSKSAKASKPKASKPKTTSSKKAVPGGGASTAAKKAGGSTKKVLSGIEKDMIAQAINDLESPHIELAIDLIKRDTGQAENDSGELELDIDQLSNEALLKLWHLCKRVLPGFGRHDKSVASEAAPAPKTSGTKSSKPKKNKPMSAREQEQKLANLHNSLEAFSGPKAGHEGSAPGIMEPRIGSAGANESSDESDSEEE